MRLRAVRAEDDMFQKQRGYVIGLITGLNSKEVLNSASQHAVVSVPTQQKVKCVSSSSPLLTIG